LLFGLLKTSGPDRPLGTLAETYIPPSSAAHTTPGSPGPVFVGFKSPQIQPIMESSPDKYSFRGNHQGAARGDDTMHDLLIALAFIGVVVAPAIYTARFSAGAPIEVIEK
jgi:hypothetical protein